MQNVRANVKVMKFQSLYFFLHLTLLIILIKLRTTKAHDRRRASGDCGTSGFEFLLTSRSLSCYATNAWLAKMRSLQLGKTHTNEINHYIHAE